MPIRAKYVHTNLIARDWKRLVRFYTDVFGCEPKGPERDMSGAWLEKVNAVPNAHLCGGHRPARLCRGWANAGDFQLRSINRTRTAESERVRIRSHRIRGGRREPSVASGDRSRRWRRWRNCHHKCRRCRPSSGCLRARSGRQHC